MNARRDVARLLTVLGCAVAGILTVSCDRATHPVAPDVGSHYRDVASSGDTIYVVDDVVPDSIKMAALINALGTSSSLQQTLSRSATPGSTLMADASAPSYVFFPTAFTPEPAPTANQGPTCDDCVMHNVPLGFTFTYFGLPYTTIDIGSNGFVGFRSSTAQPFVKNGCCGGGVIPDPITTTGSPNIIALAWTDWNPTILEEGATINYETQGTAPNRKFVLQFTHVQEFHGHGGRITAQLVIAEGSDEITMYTESMTAPFHLVTQGIQNLAGTEAYFVPGRVASQFALTNDALRFSPHPLALVLPPNLSVGTDHGLCSATVNPGTATANHDAIVSGARSDALALDAAYPKGTTSITWTATDLEPATVTGTQNVVVNDNESPSIGTAANVSADAVSSSGVAVSVSAPAATDNCTTVSVGGARSDGAALDALYPVGATTITWTATDGSGNTAASTQVVTVKLSDLIPPVLHLPASFTVNATMPSGAVVTYSATATDNIGVASLVCSPTSGSVFAIGTTSTGCTAKDAANNATSGNFNVTVLGAPDQIANLIEYIKGAPLNSTVRTSLVTYLQSALTVPTTTAKICSALSKAQTLIQGASSSKISPDSKTYLLASIARIKNVIGCP